MFTDKALPNFDPHSSFFGTSSCKARVKTYAIPFEIGINCKVPSLGPCSVKAVHPWNVLNTCATAGDSNSIVLSLYFASNGLYFSRLSEKISL